MSSQSFQALAERLKINPDRLEENEVKINLLDGRPPGLPERYYTPYGLRLSEMLFMKWQITPWKTLPMNQVINHDSGTVTLFLWDWNLIHQYDLGLEPKKGKFRQIVIPRGIEYCFVSKSESRLLLTTFDS